MWFSRREALPSCELNVIPFGRIGSRLRIWRDQVPVGAQVAASLLQHKGRYVGLSSSARGWYALRHGLRWLIWSFVWKHRNGVLDVGARHHNRNI